MHWPAPVKNHFLGPGKILSTLVAVVAAVFAVAVLGGIGVAILLGVIGIGLIVELWLEDGRKTKLLDAAGDKETELRDRVEELDKAVGDRDERLLELAAVRAELEDAHSEIEELRERLSSPVVGFEQLLQVLSLHLTFIDLVQKHRVLAHDGMTDWPIVRVSLMENDAVLIEAYAGDHAERLADEWVTVQMGEEPLETVRITNAARRDIFAVTAVDELPLEISDELTRTSSATPEGMRLRLAGLDMDPFAGLSDADLEELRDSLAGVADALGVALHPEGKQLSLNKEPEEGTWEFE